MTVEKKNKVGWKQKLLHEIIEYWINFVYLAVFFGVMITYRRLILKEYEISYLNYGIAVIEAAILAKIIIIGDVMRLGRKYEDKPLIIPTIHKTIIFGILVIGFKIIEHLVRGLIHGKGLAGGLQDLLSKGRDELLAYALVLFSAFIPFFAMKELGRVLGEGKMRALFFRGRTAVDLGPTSRD
ncbi:MAG TPA: hypothetical protein VEM40_08745 [Nitrospirota bacterium]|nr:hypothetical protein [Nitrospirota bacterium]